MCSTITECAVQDHLSDSFHFLVVLLIMITVLLQRLRCGCAVTVESHGLCFSLDLVFDSLVQWKCLQGFLCSLLKIRGDISFLLCSQ